MVARSLDANVFAGSHKPTVRLSGGLFRPIYFLYDPQGLRFLSFSTTLRAKVVVGFDSRARG